MLRVENRHVEFFYRQILEPLSEDLVHIARTANRDTILTIFCRHSSS
jgi:hypothetical protein